MVTCVVFDMDGVLCRYHVERRLQLLSEWSGMSPAEIQAAIFDAPFEDEAERGLYSAEAYLREFGQRLAYPLTATEWVEARRVATEADEAVLDLARGTGREVTVAMFTNNPFLLKDHLGQVFPAAVELFGERALVSAELGARKPDTEAFQRLAVRLECEPGEILFIDDKAENVAGAEAAGLEAAQASGGEQVAAVLDAAGMGP